MDHSAIHQDTAQLRPGARLRSTDVALVSSDTARLTHPAFGPLLESTTAQPNRVQRRADYFGNHPTLITPDDPRMILGTYGDSFIARAARLAALARLTADPDYLRNVAVPHSRYLRIIAANCAGQTMTHLEILTALLRLTFHRQGRDNANRNYEREAATDPTGLAAPNQFDVLVMVTLLIAAMIYAANRHAHTISSGYLDPPPPILDAHTTSVLTAAPPALDTTGAECSPCA